jgi:hypothetical protein
VRTSAYFYIPVNTAQNSCPVITLHTTHKFKHAVWNARARKVERIEYRLDGRIDEGSWTTEKNRGCGAAHARRTMF